MHSGKCSIELLNPSRSGVPAVDLSTNFISLTFYCLVGQKQLHCEPNLVRRPQFGTTAVGAVSDKTGHLQL